MTILAWLPIATFAAADQIGFRDVEINQDDARPLHAVIWYPSDEGSPVEVKGENPAFHGVLAIQNARPSRGEHPLLVFSHGYGGSWRNLSWLASALVERGYVVAAPDHPGTTTFNKDAAQAAKLWERPQDLSRVIDALLSDTAITVDPQRIAAIGHSLGGWTVAALAGARFENARIVQDCQAKTRPRACALAMELGLADPQLQHSLVDPRIKAFVSLDLGLARGFSPQSLATIHIPALVIAAGTDIGDMPAQLESGYLAEYLPEASSTYVTISDATHFSFMQLCKPNAVALIEEETPGDGIVCKDGGSRRREEIHRETAYLVTGFLADALTVNP
ncbi:alpha/beta fold hydrolase [Rhizobium sp. AAP43]|uniref:alpha/beta hydrolase family protein n=1 Tax=Rhizobium sp. AAP43 TaxID=1523420 RepID=UPI001FD9F6A9|nr:alpha/beta fold hydrolase [Rhizobium sp. AAP43]